MYCIQYTSHHTTQEYFVQTMEITAIYCGSINLALSPLWRSYVNQFRRGPWILSPWRAYGNIAVLGLPLSRSDMRQIQVPGAAAGAVACTLPIGTWAGTELSLASLPIPICVDLQIREASVSVIRLNLTQGSSPSYFEPSRRSIVHA